MDIFGLFRTLQDIDRKVTVIMSSVADLTAAQEALTSAVADLSTAQAKALADLKAQVAALQVAQPNLDLTSINAAIATLTSLTAADVSADPGPQPTV